MELRPGTPADLDKIASLIGLAFHDRRDDEQRELERRMLEPERSVVAEDGDLVVGHTTALTRDITVPGAIVPAAHITSVSVAPTHRRRGILTSLMRRQLAEITEPLAVLWASEPGIYGRFGYGHAASRLSLSIANREVRPHAAPETGGRFRMIEPLESIAELEAVFERQRPSRPGWSSRGEKWWRHLLSEHGSKSKTELRGVLFETSEGPQGYALWRADGQWNEFGPNGVISVHEVIGDGDEAYRAIWRFVLDLDLTRTVEYGYAAADEPLQYLVGDSGRLGRKLLDALWVRLVDVPAALEARQYATPIDVVIEVTDPVLERNTGRWRLSGGPGKVSCTRTDDPADLACSVAELGAIYLGGTPLAALVAAGRVRQLTGELPWAAFGSERLPQSIEAF